MLASNIDRVISKIHRLLNFILASWTLRKNGATFAGEWKKMNKCNLNESFMMTTVGSFEGRGHDVIRMNSEDTIESVKFR